VPATICRPTGSPKTCTRKSPAGRRGRLGYCTTLGGALGQRSWVSGTTMRTTNPLREKRPFHFAVELALDDHADKPRTEAKTPRPARRWTVFFDPVEGQRRAALGAADGPA